MADNIKRLKIEKYEARLWRQKMELRNLQLQIRPHFLLNTFNLMYSLSQMDDRENLENTILYMADYFRYIFRSNQDLESFSLELNLIKWGDNAPKYDLRRWNEDRSRMTKGITLTEDELELLRNGLPKVKF